jgi:methionyl-tRNA formyltransferase
MAALALMIKRSIGKVANETAERIEQDDAHASYCSQRVKEDGLIDWNLPGWIVHRLVRASTRPYPGAYTWAGNEEIIVWDGEVESSCRYWGVPGQVQYLENGMPAVQCGDRTRLVVKDCSCVRAHEFKVGERWGR